MQEVELVDGPDVPDGSDSPDGTGAPDVPAAQTGSLGRPHRVRRWWLVGGVAAVALSLVGIQWVVDAREDAAVARLSAVRGVIPELGETLRVVRAFPQEEIAGFFSGVLTPSGATGRLVVAEDGSQAFTAIDDRTGETTWSTPLVGPDAERAAARTSSYGGVCQGDVARHEQAAYVVCLATDGFVAQTQDEEGQFAEHRVAATSTRVVVLDTERGEVLAEWPVQEAASVALLGELVVVGNRLDQRIEVVAYDLRSGEERWRHEESREARSGEHPGESADPVYWRFFTAGDVVVYENGDRFRLLSTTGDVVRDDLDVDGNRGFSTDPATGDLVRFDVGAAVPTTTLIAPDGDPAADRTLTGGLVEVTVDDGSVPGLVLTADTRLFAWDRASGQPRWEADAELGGGVLVVRDRVYLTTGSALVALDGRTGETVWEQPLSMTSVTRLSTDGRGLVLMAGATGGAGSGAAIVHDFATGQVVRRVPFPEPITDVDVFDGVLLGWSQSDASMWRLE